MFDLPKMYILCLVFTDTPPGTSDEHLTVVKALKNVQPDGAIIVTTPQTVAISTIRREISFCRKMGVKILGLVGNMETYKCPCCGVSGNCNYLVYPLTYIYKLRSKRRKIVPMEENCSLTITNVEVFIF